METYIVHPTPDKLEAFKAFLKALKIDFEKAEYDPAFVAKIKQGEQEFREGKGIPVTLDEIWK